MRMNSAWHPLRTGSVQRKRFRVMAMTLSQLEQYIIAELENLHLKIDSEIEKLHARMDSFEGRINRLEAKMDTWFEKLSAQIARSAPKRSI